MTDSYGNFTFSGIDLHSSEKYTYALNIVNHDRYLVNEYGNSGFGPIELNKDQLINFQQFGLSASFKLLKFNLPSGNIVTSPDSFSITIEQPKLHFYEPSRIWQISTGTISNMNDTDVINIPNYAMGWWYITLNKNKSGIQTIINDSIYLGMGATANYLIPW
jgi:hypothetical protein